MKKSMKEEWRDVVGYEGRYQVSNLGRARSMHFNRWGGVRLLKQVKVTNGYLAIKLGGGKGNCKRIHRLILQSFVGEPSPKYHGAHLDGNRTNNRLDNLKWMSAQDNILMKWKHGTMLLGERCNRAVLRAQDVVKIRRWYGEGRMTQSQIARRFGVAQTSISRVVSGDTWHHIK